ncbi:tyrosine-type recombinase/integrase, partial [Escherichia coli]|uniref:tyrosine-type recombinase/integrase n=1 Tax=Escherichia coli TaxID=562 RepID=UPI003D7A6785
ADRNRSHWSTSKTPSYTKSVSWQHHRHSFATHFMINGGSIITLQRILGHTRIEQTMVYAHFAPEYLQDAISLNPLRGGTEAESVHTVSTVE